MVVPTAAATILVAADGSLLHGMDGVATSFVLAAAVWLPLTESGVLHRCAHRLSLALSVVDWLQILHQHFTQLPFPDENILRWLRLHTVHATENMNEGRVESGLGQCLHALGTSSGYGSRLSCECETCCFAMNGWAWRVGNHS